MHTGHVQKNSGKLLELISQNNRPILTVTKPQKNAAEGKKIIKLLSLPNLEIPIDSKKTDIEILDRLAEQLKPSFKYLDLLVQNINHYIDTKGANKNPVEELLKETVYIEQLFKDKLISASKEIINPLITDLLQLTAHDVNLFANFGRISTAFKNNKITNKRQACKSIWEGTTMPQGKGSKGIRTSLLEQKKLISSFFQRIEQISKNKTGVSLERSHEDFLKNLNKLFDQIQLSNRQLENPIINRLTLNDHVITESRDEIRNLFDQKNFPIKFDPILLNSILKNIINNAAENSPPDSQLNLEIKIVTETDREKPYLHIKLSNPIADPKRFTSEKILKNLNAGKQISTKQNPTETNGTFLKTLGSLMQHNDGLLKISTSRNQSLKIPEFNLELKYPLEKTSGI